MYFTPYKVNGTRLFALTHLESCQAARKLPMTKSVHILGVVKKSTPISYQFEINQSQITLYLRCYLYEPMFLNDGI